MRRESTRDDVYVTRAARFSALRARCRARLDARKRVVVHAMGAAVARACDLAMAVHADAAGAVVVDVQTDTVVVFDDYEPLVPVRSADTTRDAKRASGSLMRFVRRVCHLLPNDDPSRLCISPSRRQRIMCETWLCSNLKFQNNLLLSSYRPIAVTARQTITREISAATNAHAMSAWSRMPAPVGGGTQEWWSGTSANDGADDDAAAVDALETRLAMQREAVRAQSAPEPAGGAFAAARARDLDDEGDEDGDADYEEDDVEEEEDPANDPAAFDVPGDERFDDAFDDSEQPVSADMDVAFPLP